MHDRTIAFTLTSDDYVAAQQLYLRGRYSHPLMRVLLAILGILFLTGLFLPTGDAFFNALMVGAGAGGLAMVPFSYYVFMPRRARKLYDQQKTLHQPIEAVWSETGYDARSGETRGNVVWSDYHKWAADDKIVLLYQADNLFQMVPRAALTDAQFEDMHALARAAGLKGA